jgi:hypothetical protein
MRRPSESGLGKPVRERVLLLKEENVAKATREHCGRVSCLSWHATVCVCGTPGVVDVLGVEFFVVKNDTHWNNNIVNFL